MKLQLVDNLVMPESGDLDFLDLHPHLGLLSLATVATEYGHQVGIYDPKRPVKTRRLPYDGTLYDRVARELLDRTPDAVGFSTLGCSFVFALNVARCLKAAEPDMPILIGGPHATMLHREILECFPQFDVVVRYEAEETLPTVLEALDKRAFAGIPGITWRDTRGIRESPGMPRIEDLDSLPIASYDHYPVDRLELDLLRIEAGRGCPFACTFCSTAQFFQRKFRLKSATRLVDELDRLHARYGYTEFKLDHDLFTVSKRKVAEFCEAVKGRGYRWRVSARVDCVNEALLEQMADAGCIGLYFGIETGSERMQQISQKRLRLDLVEPTLDITERLGIEATVSFITGYPQELREDQDASLDLLGRCFRRPAGSVIPQLHILAPEPGTPLYSEFAADLKYDGYATNFNAALLGADDPDTVLAHPSIFPNYFYYPTVMPRRDHTFAVDGLDLLRSLGATVADYLLRFYEHRLSVFMAALRRWSRADNSEPKAVDLARFLSVSFGQGHHLCSLVRFAQAVNQRRTALNSAGTARAGGVDAKTSYRLSDRALLLADAHDCGALLEKIRSLPAGQTLDDALAGARVYSLTVVDAEQLRGYVIDPGVFGILTLFQSPRRPADLIEQLESGADGSPVDPALFDELVDIGALSPQPSAA